MSQAANRLLQNGEASSKPGDESVKDTLLGRLELRAKELARKQVYQEDKYRNVDRTNSKQRKRMDARISDVKQMIYKRLLEKAFTEGDPYYDEDITADLEYICNRKYEENKSLQEDNNQLKSKYDALLEMNNKLQTKVEEANSKIDALKVTHGDVVKNRDDRINELESSFGVSKQRTDKLRFENEIASRRINELREANKRLLSSPILTAKAFHEFITRSSNSMDGQGSSKVNRNDLSVATDANDSSDPVDFSCIVVEDSFSSSNDKLTESVEEFFSPKRKLIHPKEEETPTKRFRRLRLDVLISPRESQEHPPCSNIPVLMPSVVLPQSVHLQNKVKREYDS